MPPTRGHDLKQLALGVAPELKQMPPTRGHDLKLRCAARCTTGLRDAPHTGARLETTRPRNLRIFR